MMDRILLAVDDSPPALAAARLAVRLAATCGAALRAVTVVADGALDEQLAAGRGDAGRLPVTARRAHTAHSVLRHVTGLAVAAGVSCEGVALDGEVAPCILDQARAWPADLIVVGRSDRSGAGQPYIGSQTRHVLEFAEQPVLVVPYRRG